HVKWGFVRIGFSKGKLKAEIARHRSNLVILALVAVLLAGVAATLLAERISGPLRKLTQSALAISKGDLQQEISLHTGDEIEELAETFNKMTGELKLNRDEQKKLIQKLSENNRLLKQEIATREQLEEELIKVERLSALGEMSGGVAHDFNNILGAVLGRAQLLLEKVDDPKIREGIEIIEKAALDGAETVRRIQEFTRVRSDSSAFVLMDINQVISDSVEFTRTRWKEEAEAWGRP
ncbi:MAG: HAMP domain-containing protein, partial [Candidatus Aenigmarchaeota archaeon]|nr:HAMP domain-containing protein [Candidatus Aenigmarchaeota archaeon]